MIDIMVRIPAADDLFHPRTLVTTAPDAERAQALIELLDSAGLVVAGRPSGTHSTVAKLVKKRDAELARELAGRAADNQPVLFQLRK